MAQRAGDDELYPGMRKGPIPDASAEVGEALPAEQALALLAEQIRVCRNCALADSRAQAVPGEGNAHARIMLVGEAPGAMEDRTGRPFVGPSGKFLDLLLQEIGVQRDAVFIANVNRCRPPGNRDPLRGEVEACNPWMRAQLQIIKPRVVCPLGRFALEALVDPHLKISRVHGQPLEKGGMLFIPLYHPAAALHRRDLRETLAADMHAVRALLAARGWW